MSCLSDEERKDKLLSKKQIIGGFHRKVKVFFGSEILFWSGRDFILMTPPG